MADGPTAIHARTTHGNVKGSFNEQLLSQGLLVLMTVIGTGKSGGEVIWDESRYSDKIHHIYPSQSKRKRGATSILHEGGLQMVTKTVSGASLKRFRAAFYILCKKASWVTRI